MWLWRVGFGRASFFVTAINPSTRAMPLAPSRAAVSRLSGTTFRSKEARRRRPYRPSKHDHTTTQTRARDHPRSIPPTQDHTSSVSLARPRTGRARTHRQTPHRTAHANREHASPTRGGGAGGGGALARRTSQEEEEGGAPDLSTGPTREGGHEEPRRLAGRFRRCPS